jgi:hypothetical protein
VVAASARPSEYLRACHPAALAAGWPGFEIDRRFPLSAIAEAHEYVEERRGSGRVVVMLPLT